MAIPLIVVAIVVSLPMVRHSLATQFQAHPLWGALVLAVLCFLTAYLVAGTRLLEAEERTRQYRDAGLILAITLILLIVGGVLTSASSFLATEDIRPSAARAALLWAAASFMAGFLGGFLFGVPKVAGNGTTVPAPGGEAGAAAGSFAQRPNTNLEQISDWLTKIIVGLGLVELKDLPGRWKAAARWVAEGLSAAAPPSQAAISFAGSLILYFLILGFLAGYLLTLLFLAGAIGRAGQGAYDLNKSFEGGGDSEKIRKFWQPGGGPHNSANEQKLNEWIKNNLPPGTQISELIHTRELSQARQKAVAELKIQ